MDQDQFMEMLKAAMMDPTTRSIITNTLNESDPCPTEDPGKRASDEESVDSDGKSTTETKENCLILHRIHRRRKMILTGRAPTLVLHM